MIFRFGKGKEKTDMQKRLHRQLMICSSIFFAAAMAVMLFTVRYKGIEIQDVAQDQVILDEGTEYPEWSENPETAEKRNLNFKAVNENSEYLCIPLPEEIRAEDISVENYYMEKELWVQIRGIPEEFFALEGISGNVSCISSGLWEYGDRTACLKFRLKDLYECESVLEEDGIYIKLVEPKELYDKIIVIDPGHGGEDDGIQTEKLSEKEFTLDIARRIRKKMDATDIKVYYTRMEDRSMDTESRIWFANAAEADMYISIHLNSDPDPEVYGTEMLYNADFFIPEFGSLELSDLVEREVVTAISGKGNGLFAAGENDHSLCEATVPAVILQAGYATNPGEEELLCTDIYRDRIAEGVVNAVLKAYEMKEEKEN